MLKGQGAAPNTWGASEALLVPKMLCMDGKVDVPAAGRVAKLNDPAGWGNPKMLPAG